MEISSFRRRIATHCLGWCIAGVLLSLLQPFLFTHFRQDGWEDEPGFRIRNVQAMALFSPDERDTHRQALETTLYTPAGAHLESPDGLRRGLDRLMALVFLLLPLAVASPRRPRPPARVRPRRVPPAGGAPPPAVPWRTQPPTLAPPLAT